MIYQDLAHLYRDYEESQKIGNHAISEAYRNALLLDVKDRELSRERFVLTSRLDSSILDNRQQDLFIRGLANKLDEANLLNTSLHKENLSLQDEIIRLKLRHEEDSRESNETIRKLRRIIEEKEEEILVERMRGPGRLEIEERERVTREVVRLRRELIERNERDRKDDRGMGETRGTLGASYTQTGEQTLREGERQSATEVGSLRVFRLSDTRES